MLSVNKTNKIKSTVLLQYTKSKAITAQIYKWFLQFQRVCVKYCCGYFIELLHSIFKKLMSSEGHIRWKAGMTVVLKIRENPRILQEPSLFQLIGEIYILSLQEFSYYKYLFICSCASHQLSFNCLCTLSLCTMKR